MRKNNSVKILFCILLSLVMVMTMGIIAFADNEQATENLTITINPKDSVEHAFVAYQVFSGTLEEANGEVSLMDIEWGNGVDGGKLLGDLKKNEGAKDNFIVDGVNTFKECVSASDVADVLGKHPEFAEKFADVVAECLKGDGKKSEAQNSSGECIIKGLEPGYYFVKDEIVEDEASGEQKNTTYAYSDYILRLVRSVTISAKADVPSVEKKIDDNGTEIDANTASIGDTINYKITSTVPQMLGYNKYFYIITDKIQKGLTLDEDQGFTITIKGSTLIEDTDYTVDVTSIAENEEDPYSGGTQIEIVFLSFRARQIENAGEKITIEYSAKLNEKADTTSAGNKNQVSLLFSNDPNHEYKGESPDDSDNPGDSEQPDNPDNPDNPGTPDDSGRPSGDDPMGETPKDVVVTYTTGIQLIKTDSTEEHNRLKLAEFEIESIDLNQVVKSRGIYIEDNNSGTYYELKNGAYTDIEPVASNNDQYESAETKYKMLLSIEPLAAEEQVIGKLVVGDDGVVTLKGLKEGSYKITETKAPLGYTPLKNPIMLQITAGKTKDGLLDGTWSFSCTIDGRPLEETRYDSALGLFIFQVENHQGITLPNSGGIGTTIFYVLGVVFLTAAGVVFFRARRKSGKK